MRRTVGVSTTSGRSSFTPSRTTNVRWPPRTMISSTVGSSRRAPTNPNFRAVERVVIEALPLSRVPGRSDGPAVEPRARRGESLVVR
jgi:hypothetical protein